MFLVFVADVCLYRNVSYNNFTGVVPVSRNFARFSPDRWTRNFSRIHWFCCHMCSCFSFSCTVSYIGNPLICGHWLGSICDPYPPKPRGIPHLELFPCSTFSFVKYLNHFASMLLSAVFSRTTIVCITLGFITLLSMIIVALYKSNPQKQFIIGSNKSTPHGSVLVLSTFLAFAVSCGFWLQVFFGVNRFFKARCASHGHGYPHVRRHNETHWGSEWEIHHWIWSFQHGVQMHFEEFPTNCN